VNLFAPELGPALIDWQEREGLTARESAERRMDKIKAKTNTQVVGF
jgi:hypothetical protein